MQPDLLHLYMLWEKSVIRVKLIFDDPANFLSCLITKFCPVCQRAKKNPARGKIWVMGYTALSITPPYLEVTASQLHGLGSTYQTGQGNNHNLFCVYEIFVGFLRWS